MHRMRLPYGHVASAARHTAPQVAAKGAQPSKHSSRTSCAQCTTCAATHSLLSRLAAHLHGTGSAALVLWPTLALVSAAELDAGNPERKRPVLCCIVLHTVALKPAPAPHLLSKQQASQPLNGNLGIM
jgi:hypothetical protein